MPAHFVSEEKLVATKISQSGESDPDVDSISAIVENSSKRIVKPKYATDTKDYDPTKPYEIDGPAGKIGVVRGHINLQRLAGRAVAFALQGITVDQRTYEMTWMSIMLQFVTQSPGYLPEHCEGNIDQFIESLYEFDDLSHYYREWENWRNSFRVARPAS